MLSLLDMTGVRQDWFIRPQNPLSLGRSEDIVVEKSMTSVKIMPTSTGVITRQCLPLGLASGIVYSAPLYFIESRHPIGMGPKIDVASSQIVNSNNIYTIEGTGEAFYVWTFESATRQEWSAIGAPE